MLIRRRQRALMTYPSRNDSRHGMPTGNDEADLAWVTVAGHADTAYPFISIAAEAWRGMRDCGGALDELAATLPASDGRRVAVLATARRMQALPILCNWRSELPVLTDIHCPTPAEHTVLDGTLDGTHCPRRSTHSVLAGPFYLPRGTLCLTGYTLRDGSQEAAPPLLLDLHASMALDATIETDATGRNVTCHPYAAGTRECGMLPSPPSRRDSEPWRTYSEAFYSGALESSTVASILEWHQRAQGSGVRGSRLKLGVLSGCGGDVACGDQLETFTLHGWGYGLLQARA